MDENRIMEVTDENGTVKKMTILFTTKLEDDGQSYVFYLDPDDPEGNVFVNAFDDDGHLFPVEEEGKWQQLEEIFDQFMEENNDGCCKNCHSSDNETKDCDCSGGSCCCNKE